MKLLLIAAAILLAACTKEKIIKPQTCGYVFDKYFSDFNGARTYNFWMCQDLNPHPSIPPGFNWVKSGIDSITYFNMQTGTQYCY